MAAKAWRKLKWWRISKAASGNGGNEKISSKRKYQHRNLAAYRRYDQAYQYENQMKWLKMAKMAVSLKRQNMACKESV